MNKEEWKALKHVWVVYIGKGSELLAIGKNSESEKEGMKI